MSEREHDTDSLDCWCGPDYFVPCDDHELHARCWLCEGSNGLIPITREEAGREDVTCVIVHKNTSEAPINDA